MSQNQINIPVEQVTKKSEPIQFDDFGNQIPAIDDVVKAIDNVKATNEVKLKSNIVKAFYAEVCKCF